MKKSPEVANDAAESPATGSDRLCPMKRRFRFLSWFQ